VAKAKRFSLGKSQPEKTTLGSLDGSRFEGFQAE